MSCSRDCRWPACTDACTQSSSARTSSGRSSVPSARMSHSLPRRMRNGARRSFAAAISSRLAAQVVGVEPGHDADVLRVVADRDVLVAERARRLGHLEHRRLSVRPGRVHVQVAANRSRSTSAGGVPSKAASRSSGGRNGRPSAAIDARPRRAPAGSAPSDADVRRRCPSRARARCRSGRRGTATASTGTPSTVTPSAPLRLAFEHGDDLRQRGEAVEHLRRCRRRHDDGEPLRQRRASGAGRRPRRRRAAPAIPSASACARLSTRPRRGAGRASASARRSSPRSPPRCPGRRAACPRPRPRAARRRCGSPSARPRSTMRCGPRPTQAPEADELGLHLGLELVDLREAACLDQLSQPCLDRRADAAQLPHPPLPDELGDRRGRRTDQLGRAPVRAHAVGARSCEIEQRRERLQPLGDQRVVGACRHGGSVHDRWRPSLFPSAAAIPSAAWRLSRSTIASGSPRRCWATCSPLRAGSAASSSSLQARRRCPRASSTSPTRAAARAPRCATRSTRPSPPGAPAPYLVVNADLPCATPRDLLALAGAVPDGGLARRRSRRRDDERARALARRALRAALRPGQRRALRGARTVARSSTRRTSSTTSTRSPT